MPDHSFLPYFITEPIYIIAQPIFGEEPDTKVLPDDLPESSGSINIQPEKIDVKFKSRGGFKKNILLLVDDPHPEVLNITDSEFLLKILKAVQLTEDDVAIVNVQSLHKDFLPLIKEHFNYRVLIMFGIDTVSILEKYVKYKIFHESGTKILFADSLSEIDKDKQKKLKLWENLQLLFIMK
jgi:DNA polymerase III psi subunit